MKRFALVLAFFNVSFAIQLTTTRPTFECTHQNCIISFTNMDDANKFDEIISEDQSGILSLKFTSCQIEKIPSSLFDKLPSLLSLMITSPGLKILEKGNLYGASNLEFLYLPGNQIKKLLKGAFDGAFNLNDINLSDNGIEVVSEDAFNGLKYLESLNLSKNQIAFFSEFTFSPLTELTNLDLSGNMIEFLDVQLFSKNKKLNGINIANNQILSITNGFLSLCSQIKVFNVMNNPCTKNTALENVPLIKIIDNKDFNSDDEIYLEKCYENYRTMNSESSDYGDLLDKAQVVQEDIEANIINNLNLQVRDRDLVIKELEREKDLQKIIIVFGISILMFFFVLKIVINVVNSTFITEKENIIPEIVPNQKQLVYTIEI